MYLRIHFLVPPPRSHTRGNGQHGQYPQGHQDPDPGGQSGQRSLSSPAWAGRTGLITSRRHGIRHGTGDADGLFDQL